MTARNPNGRRRGSSWPLKGLVSRASRSGGRTVHAGAVVRRAGPGTPPAAHSSPTGQRTGGPFAPGAPRATLRYQLLLYRLAAGHVHTRAKPLPEQPVQEAAWQQTPILPVGSRGSAVATGHTT